MNTPNESDLQVNPACPYGHKGYSYKDNNDWIACNVCMSIIAKEFGEKIEKRINTLPLMILKSEIIKLKSALERAIEALELVYRSWPPKSNQRPLGLSNSDIDYVKQTLKQIEEVLGD